MKRLCFILVLIFLTAACNMKPKSENTVPVKVYWDYLDTDNKPIEVGSRLKDERMERLTPSDDYGKLVPFLGEMLGIPDIAKEDPDIPAQDINLYGLMTTDGKVVLDAVCSSINGEDFNYNCSCYIMAKGTDKNVLYAASALDGSWATDFIYQDIKSYNNKTLTCIRDFNKNNFDILDAKNGGLIFNSCSNGLADKMTDNYLTENSISYYNDYCSVRNENGTYSLYNKNGDILKSSSFSGIINQPTNFDETGLAYVDIDKNTKGYINKKGELVIRLNSSVIYGEGFCSKNIACVHTDNGKKIINSDGRVIHTFKNNSDIHPEIIGDKLYYVSYTECYDENFNEIKTKSGLSLGYRDNSTDKLCATSSDNSLLYVNGKEFDISGCEFRNITDNYYLISDSSGVFKLFSTNGEKVLETEGCYLYQLGSTEFLYDFYTQKLINLTDNITIEKVVRRPYDGDFVCCYDGISVGTKNIHTGEWVYRTLKND